MTRSDRDAIRVIAFDVFGTTVDWYTGVSEQVGEILGTAGVELDAPAFASAWRGRYAPSLLRVLDGTRAWADLDTLHRESLDDLLREFGVAGSVDEQLRARLVRAWHRLPPWDDAVAGLARLRERYVVAALSNGGFALLTHLIKDAGLPFDCVISAELARTYKPDPRAYRFAAELLDVAPGQMLMVACHRWDLDGARRAGLRTAFVERPREKGPAGTADRAADTASDIAAPDFAGLADALERGDV